MNPSVCYFSKKLKLSKKSDLLNQIQELYLRPNDRQFLIDLINGLSYKDLSKKYNISYARVYQIRERLCEQIHQFDIANGQIK